MTGWITMLLLALVTWGALWRLARLPAAALQLAAAALLVASAGYAWQGQPGLGGAPKRAVDRRSLPKTAFATLREDMLGRFDNAAHWLLLAERYQQRGDTRSGVDIIRSGIRQNPDDADLWVGLGSALVAHGGGLMNPAAELAFARARRLAPRHPGPAFFYGLALAQNGRIEEAERIWRRLLDTGRKEGEWRPIVEERLRLIDELRASGQLPPGGAAEAASPAGFAPVPERR